MNKLQEMTVFSGRQKFTSTMKRGLEKLWYTSNFMLYTSKEPPEVGLVEKLSGSLYIGGWSVCQPYNYRGCYCSVITQNPILKSVRVHFAYGLTLELLGRFGRFLDEDDCHNPPVLLIPFLRHLGL